MTDKILVAIFDANQRCIIRRCEVTDDGGKIRVKKGGKAHFYPEFDNTSYLDHKRAWYLGGGYKRVYYVRNNASKCLNFQTGHVPMPDPKEVFDAADARMIKNIGSEEQKTPWFDVINIFLLIVILLVVLKIAGVIN